MFRRHRATRPPASRTRFFSSERTGFWSCDTSTARKRCRRLADEAAEEADGGPPADEDDAGDAGTPLAPPAEPPASAPPVMARPTEQRLSPTHATYISEPNSHATTAVVPEKTWSTPDRRTTASADVKAARSALARDAWMSARAPSSAGGSFFLDRPLGAAAAAAPPVGEAVAPLPPGARSAIVSPDEDEWSDAVGDAARWRAFSSATGMASRTRWATGRPCAP